MLTRTRLLAPLVPALLGVVLTAGCQSANVPAAPVELKVTIAGGKVEPSGAQVDVPRGASVHLTVTSDQADAIHVHGYDQEAEVAPGKPADLTFVADRVGRFEVETHHPSRVVARLNVR